MKICGVNSIFEALKAGKVLKIYYTEASGKAGEILEIAKKFKVPCYKRKMAEKICAEISPVSYSTVEEIARKAIAENSFILILDNVNDPQNLGACIRSSEFFGCSGVVIKRRRAVQITEGVIRASAGAVFHIKIACEVNLASTVKKLKNLGFFVVGAEIGGKDLRNTKMSPPLVLVVGGEDRGISIGVKKLCDEIVQIPGAGKVGSLNLSVACGIIMFEIFKLSNFSNV
ncbi:MAG: 23S rRNA (guanosine(2251)-2'-O)-methyltransferase RlmB [Archaeoglobaceae archaeon]